MERRFWDRRLGFRGTADESDSGIFYGNDAGMCYGGGRTAGADRAGDRCHRPAFQRIFCSADRRRPGFSAGEPTGNLRAVQRISSRQPDGGGDDRPGESGNQRCPGESDSGAGDRAFGCGQGQGSFGGGVR